MSNAKISPISASRAHADKPALVDIDNVSVRFGGEQALDDVSFCVHAGEFVGLIGPNGAGKTTLLRVLLGLQGPTTGTVRRQQAVVGYIPQRAHLYNGIVPMSAVEVVALGAPRATTSDILDALESVGMRAVADRRFTELSGGQQQRVVIAKALVGGADLLILDEPTTGVDEQSQGAFYTLLHRLQGRGMTIIMVSHEVDTVLRLVTRVICLNQSILYDGAPEHFEADQYLPQYYKKQHLRLHHHHEVPRA